MTNSSSTQSTLSEGAIKALFKANTLKANHGLTKISNLNIVNALVYSSILILPIAIFRALLQVLQPVFAMSGQPAIADYLYGINSLLLELNPLLFGLVITYIYAIYLRISVITNLLCSLVAIANINYVTQGELSVINTNLLMIVLVTLLCSHSIKACSRLRKARPEDSTPLIETAITTFIQFLVVFISSLLLAHALFYFRNYLAGFAEFFHTHLIPHDFMSGATYELVRNLCWFFGVHSYHVLGELAQEFQQLSSQRVAALAAGQSPDCFITYDFMDIYSAIGGSGSTLSLILAILLFSKNRSYRKLGKISTPFSLVNINEPLIYGIPIIYNVWLALPFLFLPILNYGIAYWLTDIGFLPPLVRETNWIYPPLYNVWVATDGSVKACLVQLGLIIGGALIYRPFINRYAVDRNLRFKESDALETNLPVKFSHYRDVIFEHNQARNTANKVMENGEMLLYVQPQFCLKRNTIVGGEVLIRHQDKQRKVHPPYFLDMFEKIGMSIDIDYLVIRKTADFVKQNSLPRGFKLSINVTPSSFQSEQIIKALLSLADKMKRRQLELVIEITENQEWEQESNYPQIFALLQQHGMQISLDDFGTGYSNIANVLSYNFNYVKLDMSLVSKKFLVSNPDIVKGMMLIAQSTGAKLVAEGVECQEQVDILSANNVHIFQGYFFARPMPLHELVASLQQQTETASH